MLEVHSSTDTWIGLAAGRQIMEQTDWLNIHRTFPKQDTFSFTFYGTVWYNQNWLSHVYLWLLYDWFGPAAVILGTWALTLGTFLLVLFATRARCGAMTPAILAAAIVAFASRDWFSARPATMQFFLIAGLMLIFALLLTSPPQHAAAPASAPAAPGARARDRLVWMLIALLLPLFLIWGNAHGSFVFGYGLVGIFIACSAAARFLRPTGAPLSWMETTGLATAAGLAALLTILVGPYGLDNFLHPLKVAESEVFRRVSEWKPPFVKATYPPVERFWIALAIAAAAPLVTLALRTFGRSTPQRTTSAPAPVRYPLHALFFDLAAVGIGLYMALFARRFAPLFYILATPAITTWVLMLAARIAPNLRERARDAILTAAWPSAICIALITARLGHRELVVPFAGGQYNLLERVTRFDAAARGALAFLQHNELPANVFCEWVQAGPVMFFVPTARVFMDGRAQQVYTERHYNLFGDLIGHDPREWQAAIMLLEQHGTNAVMLRRSRGAMRMWSTVERSPDWLLVCATLESGLFLRAGSVPMTHLIELERAGRAWWPADPECELARGIVCAAMDPPELDRAKQLWREGLRKDPALGLEWYARIVAHLAHQTKWDAAADFLAQQADNMKAGSIDPVLVRELSARIEQLQRVVEARRVER